MKENMKAEAAALITEMRKRSVTGTGIMLSAGSNGLLVAAFDAMQAELTLNSKDTIRLDWLADSNQLIGNVQLPTDCVIRAIDMRDAIDMAMQECE